MSTEESRSNRKLDYTGSTSAASSESAQELDKSKCLEKVAVQDLELTFKKEIDDLVERAVQEKIEALTKELKERFARELRLQQEKVEAELKELNQKVSILEELIREITVLRREHVLEEITSLDTVLIEITIECLFKILGDRKTYQRSVCTVIDLLTKKIAANIRVTLRVSDSTYNFLASIYEQQSVMNFIAKDNSLSEGQIILDDGTSITEIGLLDQLDLLRTSFIGELRDHHGL